MIGSRTSCRSTLVAAVCAAALCTALQEATAGEDNAVVSSHVFDAGENAPRLLYDAYRPIEAGSAAEIVVVLIHGWGGRARSVLQVFAPALRARAGDAAAAPYVIAPLFPRRVTMAKNREPDDGRAVWCDSWSNESRDPTKMGLAADDWRGGGDANGTTYSSFDYIDAIFARLAERAKYPNLRKVVLAGFSAGGQFVGRYVATGKGVVRPGVQVTYVDMSPSTQFRFERDVPWHYGLHGRPRYSAALTEAEIMTNLTTRRVWRGCGSADILGRPVTSLDMTPPAAAQGASRFERFRNFEKYLDRFPEWKRQVSFHVFEGIGHKEKLCYPDPALLDFIFEPAPAVRAQFLHLSHVHRGGGAREAPDNTLETFKWCWSNGSAVECDCRRTKDGVGIMLHDDRLKRTGRGISEDLATNSVSRSLTWEQIRDVDVGLYQGKQFKGQHIPTIEQVFDAMKGHPSYLCFVDEKGAGPEYIAKKAIEAGVQDQVYYTGPSHEKIIEWQKTLPGGKAMIWLGAWPKNHDAAERQRTNDWFRKKMAELRAKSFKHINVVSIHSYYDPNDAADPFVPSTPLLREMVREFHSRGIKVVSIPFQGGALEETYFKLWQLGFDGFSTDYPSVMFGVIRRLSGE